MENLEGGRPAGGKDHYPRCDRLHLELRRAPGAGGRASGALRADGRTRTDYRRGGLRLWHLCGPSTGGFQYCVDEASGPGRRCQARLARAVVRVGDMLRTLPGHAERGEERFRMEALVLIIRDVAHTTQVPSKNCKS